MYGLKRLAFQSIFVFTILMLCPWLVNASPGAVNTQKIAHFMQYLTNCSHTNASPQECLSKAKNTYLKTFSLEDDLTTREAGFVAFLIYYNEMLDLLNENEEGFLGDFNKAIDSMGWDAAAAKFDKKAREYGFKLDGDGQGGTIAVTDFNFLLKTFGQYIPKEWATCFAYFIKFEHFAGYEGVSEEAMRAIEFEELRKMIILEETILLKHPHLYNVSSMTNFLHWMLDTYIFGTGANIPLTMGNKKILRPDIKISYENFLTENKSSSFYPLIEYAYALFKNSRFAMTDEYEISLRQKMIDMKIVSE